MSKKRLTTQEVAQRLRISARRVRQLVEDGTLEAERFGRDLAITALSVRRAAKRPRRWQRQ